MRSPTEKEKTQKSSVVFYSTLNFRYTLISVVVLVPPLKILSVAVTVTD